MSETKAADVVGPDHLIQAADLQSQTVARLMQQLQQLQTVVNKRQRSLPAAVWLVQIH